MQFITILLLFVLFFSIDIVANKLYLYWNYGYLDGTMHFFGGLLVGLFFILLLKLFDKDKGRINITTSKTLVFITVLVSSFAVGVMWEIAEYVFGVTHASLDFVPDTIRDLLMDIVGGSISFIAWIMFSRSHLISKD